MTRRIRDGVALILALLATAGAATAETPSQTVELLVRRAQGTLGDHRYFEAEVLLNLALGLCADGSAGRSCRALVLFNLGYLHHLAADGADTERLQRAVDAYAGALGETRHRLDILESYVGALLQLGEPGRARAALVDAGLLAWTFSATRYTFSPYTPEEHVRIGDLFRALGDVEAAVAHYQRAAHDAPGDIPRRRILAALPDRTVDDLERLIDHGDGLRRDGLGHLAADAYARALQQMVRAHASRRRPTLTRRAVLGWIDAAAGADLLSEAELERLPGVPAPMLDWMRRAADDPRGLDKDPAFGLLPDSESRRHVAATVLWSLGRRRLHAGLHAEAFDAFVLALRVAPALTAYAQGPLDDRTVVPVLVATDLLEIVDLEPALDPKRKRFRAAQLTVLLATDLLRLRFDDVARRAIEARLGQIYAGSSERRVDRRRARELLRRAVAGAPTPEPVLWELLAETSIDAGRRAEALAAYRCAVEDALDLDDLALADRLLIAVHETVDESGDETVPRWIEDLENVLRTRRERDPGAVAGTVLAELAGGGGPARLEPARDAGLVVTALDGPGEARCWGGCDRGERYLEDPPLDSGFRRRQRFKLLADLMSSVSRYRATGLAWEAVGALGTEDRLAASRDLRRFERIVDVIQSRGWIASPEEPMTVAPLAEPAVAPLSGFREWTLFMADRGYALRVRLNGDVLRRLETLWTLNGLAVAGGEPVQVAGRRVLLPLSASSAADPDQHDRLVGMLAELGFETWTSGATTPEDTPVGLVGSARTRDGRLLPEAAVTVESATGEVRRTRTDARGEFRVVGLPQGIYRVVLAASGEGLRSEFEVELAGASSTWVVAELRPDR